MSEETRGIRTAAAVALERIDSGYLDDARSILARLRDGLDWRTGRARSGRPLDPEAFRDTARELRQAEKQGQTLSGDDLLNIASDLDDAAASLEEASDG